MLNESETSPTPVKVARRGFLAGVGALAGLAAVGRSAGSVAAKHDDLPGPWRPWPAPMKGSSSQTAPAPPPTPAPTTTAAPTKTAPASAPTTTPPSTAPAGPIVADGNFHSNALFVSLYGFPQVPALGCLGEQDPSATVFRSRLLAASYDQWAPGGKALPALEIIATVASTSPGPDGNYSAEHPVSTFRPYIDAATAAGVHLVFDLQPGRASFLDQARAYEELWRLPNVSIALDPEWRVGPTQRPGNGLVGTVDASEINATIDYIDSVITANKLPPKMCLIHQFRPVMITNQAQVRGTSQVTAVFQMDGLGRLSDKQGTWTRMVANVPAGALTAWKNFYLFDSPLASPAQTMANTPAPIFVSYQ